MKEVVITADSTCDLPKSIIEKNKQEDILQVFDNLEAKELTPELYNMANMIKNKEIGDDGSR